MKLMKTRNPRAATAGQHVNGLILNGERNPDGRPSPHQTRGFIPLLRRLAVVGCLAGLVSGATAEDWPQWRGPDQNGISRETAWTTDWPIEGPKQLWKASVGIGFSSIAVAQGRAFTLGYANSNDTVFCLDVTSGKELWKHSYPSSLDDNYYEGGPATTPLVDGTRVFTLGKRGTLLCLETGSGKLVWEKNLVEAIPVAKPEWGFSGSPVVVGDLLIINAGKSGVALNKSTGATVWSSGTNAAGYATPVLYNTSKETSLALFTGEGLVGVRASDGRELWRHPWSEEFGINAVDPVLPSNDRAFLTSYKLGCALLQLGENSVTEIWTNSNLAVGFSSCVLVDGHIYGIHGTAEGNEKEVRCIELSTGALKWKQEKFGLGTVTVASGKLILLSDRGELVIAEASPEKFKPLARSQVLGGKCWTVPVLANGRIYCRNAKGSLVCLDVRPSPGDSKALPVSAREPGVKKD